VKTARIVLGLFGGAAGVFGLVLLVPPVLAQPSIAVWLIAPPVLHDALAVPAALAVLLLLRRVSRRHKAVLGAALAASVIVAALAVPVLWRADAGAPNPGLDDRDYTTGVAVLLIVIWAIAALAWPVPATAIVRRARRRRPSRGA
jgi:hypothetical protein